MGLQYNNEFGSRSDRRLTQVGTQLKGYDFRMGYAASFASLLLRGSRNFCQLRVDGGPSPSDTSPHLLILQKGPNGLFQGNL